MTNAKGRYPIPGATHRVEEEIRRSRFITTVAHTPTVEDARAFMASMREEFSDASHNCWAYLIGPPGSTSQVGMSDDGEPHGTAGRPMLMVLEHAGFGDIAAVVTRYFGGTLLGKGGLVRAYSNGVQLALESLPVSERIPSIDLQVVVDYSAVTPLQRLFNKFEILASEEEYALDVTYSLRIPEEQADPFVAAVTDLTNGQALIEVVDEGGDVE
jgi:uncharacterized YigZ family protein